jgi:[ribosomal protein S5]-alanine N-acetyltransferase
MTIDETDGFTFALSLHDTERIIGIIGLNRFDSLSYMLHPDFWNKGYCTEAVRYFLDYLFKQQPERREITAWVFEDNVASRRVLEKCGFVTPVEKGGSITLSLRSTIT